LIKALELKKERRMPLSASTQRQIANQPVDQQELESLRVRVELQQDEITALKTNIQQLLHRKQEEVKQYNHMLDKTQQILMASNGSAGV
jgi:uncharacterized protein (DUF342 family)